MNVRIRVYDKNLMFKSENVSCNFTDNSLEIFCPNLTKEKIINLKIEKFKKKENEILSFPQTDITIIDDNASKIYTGTVIFDENKECIILENYQVKNLINLACFNFINQIKL